MALTEKQLEVLMNTKSFLRELFRDARLKYQISMQIAETQTQFEGQYLNYSDLKKEAKLIMQEFDNVIEELKYDGENPTKSTSNCNIPPVINWTCNCILPDIDSDKECCMVCGKLLYE